MHSSGDAYPPVIRRDPLFVDRWRWARSSPHSYALLCRLGLSGRIGCPSESGPAARQQYGGHDATH
jgi:hypothetical protein